MATLKFPFESDLPMAVPDPSRVAAEINSSGTPTPDAVVTLPVKLTVFPDVLITFIGIFLNQFYSVVK